MAIGKTERLLRAICGALAEILESQKTVITTLEKLMSNQDDLNAAETRLAADVTAQTADIALIQNNLTAQLADLSAEIQKLQTAQPALDLTNITMSINQIETNHAALLALAKQAAGIDTIPPPPPLVPATPPADSPPPAPAAPPADAPPVVAPS